MTLAALKEPDLKWLWDLVERNRRRRQRLRDLPPRSLALLMGVAFCLFASIGAMVQLNDPRWATPRLAVLYPVMMGISGAWVLWLSMSRIKLVWTLVGALSSQAVVTGVYVFLFTIQSVRGPVVPDTVQRFLTLTSVLAIMLMACLWSLAFAFIDREGERFFQVQTEMRLAGEIHRALVPTIEHCIGDFEFYGVSMPSGQVGGDLVDVHARDGRWLAYVVDVSGHGVSAGVLMAMIKSSIHTTLHFQSSLDGLLEEVNRVLCNLKTGNMFATCGLIAFSPEHGLRYALAGHLPILRVRDQHTELLGENNLPLGIVPDSRFQAVPCEMKKGDVLVVVTDGLTEVAGKDGEELGFKEIAGAARDQGSRPAKEIAEEILRAVNRGGPLSDDQSLLVVRRLG